MYVINGVLNKLMVLHYNKPINGCMYFGSQFRYFINLFIITVKLYSFTITLNKKKLQIVLKEMFNADARKELKYFFKVFEKFTYVYCLLY